MPDFVLFAEPWWVNLLILIPIIVYFYWRKNKLNLTSKILSITSIFGAAFGFVEAAVVIYLRAALGINPQTGIAETSQNIPIIPNLSQFITIELVREATTIIMLIAVALLAVKSKKERFAVFLWVFAIWDIFYYIGLFLGVGWPSSLLTSDLLFLIPVPWYSQVWYPLLVSILICLAIILNLKRKRKK